MESVLVMVNNLHILTETNRDIICHFQTWV